MQCFLVAGAWAAMTATLIGCEPSTTVPQNRAPGVSPFEIRIGSSSALTGQANFLGTQLLHGSEAWLNEVNAKGGIRGRKITIVSLDDGYEPARAVTMTQKLLVEEDVLALFDFVGTPTSVKVLPLVNRARVPLLGLLTGAEALRTPLSPWVFHVRDSYYAEAEGAIALFVDRLKLQRIGIIYQQDAFGQAVLSGVQLALARRRLQPTAAESFARGTLEVARACDAMKSAGAEAVVLVGTYAPLAKAVKTSHDAGFTPWFDTVSFVGTEAYARELVDKQRIDKANYARLIVTQVVPSPYAEEFPGVQEYRALVHKYFSEDAPNYVALEGFINAKVLTAILERAGQNLDRDSLVHAAESVQDLDVGIGTPITFGPADHVGLHGVYYSRLHVDGTFRLATPEEISP